MKTHDTPDRSPATPSSPTVRHTIDEEARGSVSVVPVLLASGFLLVGLVLSLLPTLLPQYGWITAGFAKHGLTGAPLLLSGCVLIGATLLLRGRQAPLVVELPREDTGLGERLATEIADVRGVLGELRMEVIYLRDAQRALLQSYTDSSEPADEGQKTAIFRLAASLDQIGARLEQRLAQHHATLRGSIEGLDQRLAERQLSTGATAGASAYAALESLGGEHLYTDVARVIEAADAFEGELEAQTAGRGLGLLDTLDDPSQHPAPTPASLLGSSPHAIDPALYATGRAARAGQGDGTGPMLEDKLGLLKSLLADGDVRDALATMRGSGR